jgi:hypothetical protein
LSWGIASLFWLNWAKGGLRGRSDLFPAGVKGGVSLFLQAMALCLSLVSAAWTFLGDPLPGITSKKDIKKKRKKGQVLLPVLLLAG